MRFRDYYTAMKAVDPTIRIGIVAVPGEDHIVNNTDHPVVNPRTGVTHYGWTPVLLATLNSLGVMPDFLVHHFYPEQGLDDDADLLQATYNWAGAARDLRQQLDDYLGTNAANVELVCTENNSDGGPHGPAIHQPRQRALSGGQRESTHEDRIQQLPSGGTCGTEPILQPTEVISIRPSTAGGAMAISDSINSGNRHPTFYALKLMQYFAQAGDTVLDAANADPLLSTYAVRRASGAVNLLAINKDPANTITHQITLTGFVPNGTATIRSYGIPQDEATRTNAPAAAQDIATGIFTGVAPTFSYSFPPYSITLFTFEPPGEPWLTVTRVSPNSVTVSWANLGSYTLQTNGNLTAPGWNAYGGTVTTSNGTNSVTITPPTGSLFFRLGNP